MNITERKIRFAVLGCGRISREHFKAIEQCERDIDLVAVCDGNKEKAELAAHRMGARSYTDLEKMLKGEDLDMVAVATPNCLHAQHVMEVANHCVHVLTEKPMAIKLEDGIKMEAHCREKGVQLYILYQNRFNETSQALYRARKEGRFGKIYLITSNIFWMRPSSYYEGVENWRGSRETDGGMFYTQASHYVDLMTWLIGGKVKTIYSNLKTLGRDIETADTGVINLEWVEGTLGAINATVLTYPDNYEGSITILGEKGTVRVGGIAMNEIQHWDFADSAPEDAQIKGFSYQTESVYGFGHIKFYQSIVQAFRGKEAFLVTGEDGLDSLRILDAITRSSDMGRPIELEMR